MFRSVKFYLLVFQHSLASHCSTLGQKNQSSKIEVLAQFDYPGTGNSTFPIAISTHGGHFGLFR